MKSTFSEIKSLIDQLAAKINVPKEQLPYYGFALNRGDGFAYVEIDKNGQPYYVAWERGSETFRYKPIDMDDLLYLIFKGATSSISSEHELKDRVKGRDFRRIWFAEHERLIGLLNKDWEKRLHKYYQDVLSKHPFDDNASIRVDYLSTLKSEGMEHNAAWLLACEKYPMPTSN